MKWSLCLGAVLAAAVIFPGSRASVVSSAAAAVPTPAALQYDEVIRMIVPPAPPPAPDSFQTAYQSLASATPKPQPHGFFGFAQRAINAVQGITQGHLARYTYYRGWVRTDDPAAQTATIEKCSGGTIHLDLAKKTYTVDQPEKPCPHGETTEPSQPGPQDSAAPGTVDLTVTAQATALGPLTIDGIGTTGSRRQLELNMSNATGSCHNGDAKMSSTEYVSKIVVPRRYCPLPKMKIPSTFSMATGSRGGCTPNIHGRMENAGSAFAAAAGNRLALFVLTSFGGSAGADSPSGSLMMAIQRGNVHWLSGAPAEALFAVPPDFTRAGS